MLVLCCFERREPMKVFSSTVMVDVEYPKQVPLAFNTRIRQIQEAEEARRDAKRAKSVLALSSYNDRRPSTGKYRGFALTADMKVMEDMIASLEPENCTLRAYLPKCGKATWGTGRTW